MSEAITIDALLAIVKEIGPPPPPIAGGATVIRCADNMVELVRDAISKAEWGPLMFPPLVVLDTRIPSGRAVCMRGYEVVGIIGGGRS